MYMQYCLLPKRCHHFFEAASKLSESSFTLECTVFLKKLFNIWLKNIVFVCNIFFFFIFNSFVQPLDQPLSGYGIASMNGGIFISGGFNCKYTCLVSMFLYHPERGTIYLADMTHDRALHCMESHRGCLYVAGGVCNHKMFYSDQLACEVYNPVADSWTAVASLPVPHVGGASAVLEEKMYVLGGYSQEDYSESGLVHRFDPSMQRWENMGKLPGAVTDIQACLLRLPQHLRQ